uniref:Calcitonin receptor-like n=1 Tax=Hirondellea gigas TaxID=1518452 RepID=A0A6A7G6V9_9CRUS
MKFLDVQRCGRMNLIYIKKCSVIFLMLLLCVTAGNLTSDHKKENFVHTRLKTNEIKLENRILDLKTYENGLENKDRTVMRNIHREDSKSRNNVTSLQILDNLSEASGSHKQNTLNSGFDNFDMPSIHHSSMAENDNKRAPADNSATDYEFQVLITQLIIAENAKQKRDIRPKRNSSIIDDGREILSQYVNKKLSQDEDAFGSISSEESAEEIQISQYFSGREVDFSESSLYSPLESDKITSSETENPLFELSRALTSSQTISEKNLNESSMALNSSRNSNEKKSNSNEDSKAITSRDEKDAGSCRLGISIRSSLSVSDGVFARASCFWCYVFVAPHRKPRPLRLDYQLHGFLYENSSRLEWFDPSNTTTWATVAGSLLDPVEAGKLRDCCQEANICCEHMMEGEEVGDLSDHCPRTWDGWSCLPLSTAPGVTVPIKCPVHAYTGYPECYLHGKKRCGSDGEWGLKDSSEHTDYSSCSMKTFHLTNYSFELSANALSLLALTPAIFVLLYYKELRVHRFRMHLNFFIALWLRSFFKILELSLIKLPEILEESTLLEDNGSGCRVLTTLNKFALLSVWGWMLAESIYLYRLVARAFSRVTTIIPYMLGAWGGSTVLSLVWALCRALLEDYQCWLGDHKGDTLQLHLLTDVPIMIILLVNTVLLIYMAVLMYSQLRGRHTDDSDINRKALKAMLFLVPIFGAQFLLTAVAPIGIPCTGLQVYLVIVTALIGLQGLYVSIFCCYRENKVIKQLRRTKLVLQIRYLPFTLHQRGDDTGRPHTGVTGDGSTFEPQTTYSTVQSETVTEAPRTRHADEGVELMPLRGGNRDT